MLLGPLPPPLSFGTLARRGYETGEGSPLDCGLKEGILILTSAIADVNGRT